MLGGGAVEQANNQARVLTLNLRDSTLRSWSSLNGTASQGMLPKYSCTPPAARKASTKDGGLLGMHDDLHAPSTCVHFAASLTA
jgi:hypothetical protein